MKLITESITVEFDSADKYNNFKEMMLRGMYYEKSHALTKDGVIATFVRDYNN